MTRVEPGPVVARFLLVASGPRHVPAEGKTAVFSRSGLVIMRDYTGCFSSSASSTRHSRHSTAGVNGPLKHFAPSSNPHRFGFTGTAG